MKEYNILLSPYKKSVEVIPKVTLAEFLLNNLKNLLPTCASKYWVIDVKSNIGITFGDVEEYSRKVASFLYKKGFRPGDYLYYITYEAAEIYLINLAVWRLGGAVRGSYQAKDPDLIETEINEINAKFIVVDSLTVDRVINKENRFLISVGHEKVKNTVRFKEMLLDDGKGLPDYIECNTYDPAIVPTTSGSTSGIHKGVIHSHFNILGDLFNILDTGYGTYNSISMTPSSNYSIASHNLLIRCLYKGMTAAQIRYFDSNTYLKYLQKYKPDYLVIYSFVASWLVRCPEFQTFDTSFIKYIIIAGSVLDKTTYKLLQEKLSKDTVIEVKYGASEIMLATSTTMCNSDEIITANYNGHEHVSCGKPLPFVKIKVIDLDNGETLGPYQKGEIMVNTPFVMQRYTNETQNKLLENDGWYHTEDVGFYDEYQNLYVIERKTFIYKYLSYFIAPSIIEGTLSEHKAVLSVGVLGIPNPVTEYLSRAFVVLKPGYNSTTIDKELIKFVADRLPLEFQLHGGVRFISKLPLNKNLKLDRIKLKELSLNLN